MKLENKTSKLITFTDRASCQQWSCKAKGCVVVPDRYSKVIEKLKKLGCVESKAKTSTSYSEAELDY